VFHPPFDTAEAHTHNSKVVHIRLQLSFSTSQGILLLTLVNHMSLTAILSQCSCGNSGEYVADQCSYWDGCRFRCYISHFSVDGCTCVNVTIIMNFGMTLIVRLIKMRLYYICIKFNIGKHLSDAFPKAFLITASRNRHQMR
jgi:hypothetical protein